MNQVDRNIVIFLGDTDGTVAERAKAFDDTSRLLDSGSLDQFLTSPRNGTEVWYTSLGDLPDDLSLVIDILGKSDRIIYCPPAIWSDGRSVDCVAPSESIQGLTEIILCLLPTTTRVENLRPEMRDPVQLADNRRSDHAQIWNVGCSVTDGSYIPKEKRYGQLLAERLNMPVSFLSKPGRSIIWAADQILRSDIRNKDLVIWGLTSPERLMYIHNHLLLEGVTPITYDRHPDYKKLVAPYNLASHDNLYKQYYAVQQVSNFCKQIGANLILLSLVNGNHFIQRAFTQYANYVHIPYRIQWQNRCMKTVFLDYASDNMHPGVLQHQQYSKLIYDHIYNNHKLRHIYIKNH